MAKVDKPDLSIKFLYVFRVNSLEPTFPSLTYLKKGEVTTLPVLVATEPDHQLDSHLHMLHPQARTFLSESVKRYSLSPVLIDELRSAHWRGNAPKWVGDNSLALDLHRDEQGLQFQVKIEKIEAFLFPTQILITTIDISPSFPLNDETAPTAAKMLTSRFVRAGKSFSGGGFKAAALSRMFRAKKKQDANQSDPPAGEDQRESAIRRFSGNDIPLIRGICGEPLTLIDVIKSILPNECFCDSSSGGQSCERAFLMGDRFLTSVYLRTSWDGQGRAYSDQEHIDLIRMSRGEDDLYEPVRDPVHNEALAIKTFENIAFCPSAEGVVCWVKARPTQEFLKSQFKIDRYDRIYFQLYLLALHQRYALVNYAQRLEEKSPLPEDMKRFGNINDISISNNIELFAHEMRQMRREVSNFYLRYFFQQPATLSNHQEYYRILQRELGVSELLEEVRQAAAEFEYLMSSLHDKLSQKNHNEHVERQNEQQSSILKKVSNLIDGQKKLEHIHFWLSVAVEITAVPYYSYNFANHILHMEQKESALLAILTSLAVVIFTAYGFAFRKHEN
jgi:hypothetical protein